PGLAFRLVRAKGPGRGATPQNGRGARCVPRRKTPSRREIFTVALRGLREVGHPFAVRPAGASGHKRALSTLRDRGTSEPSSGRAGGGRRVPGFSNSRPTSPASGGTKACLPGVI